VNDFIDSDQRIKEKSFLLTVPLFAAAGLVWAGLWTLLNKLKKQWEEFKKNL